MAPIGVKMCYCNAYWRDYNQSGTGWLMDEPDKRVFWHEKGRGKTVHTQLLKSDTADRLDWIGAKTNCLKIHGSVSSFHCNRKDNQKIVMKSVPKAIYQKKIF